jgi:hypothetical protein
MSQIQTRGFFVYTSRTRGLKHFRYPFFALFN